MSVVNSHVVGADNVAGTCEFADPNNLLGIDEVAARVGLSAHRIRALRSNACIAKYGHHPLFSLGFKVGGETSRLRWRESDVEAFLDQRRMDALGRAS